MRVYINRFDAEHIWSVDEGSIETETQWDSVIILCPAYTRMDMSKRGSKTEPCCWIECVGKLYDNSFRDLKQAVIQ